VAKLFATQGSRKHALTQAEGRIAVILVAATHPLVNFYIWSDQLAPPPPLPYKSCSLFHCCHSNLSIFLSCSCSILSAIPFSHTLSLCQSFSSKFKLRVYNSVVRLCCSLSLVEKCGKRPDRSIDHLWEFDFGIFVSGFYPSLKSGFCFYNFSCSFVSF